MNNGDKPAMPRAGNETSNLADYVRHESVDGLTKREEFARTAMNALLIVGYSNEKFIAQLSVAMADALLAELEK